MTEEIIPGGMRLHSSLRAGTSRVQLSGSSVASATGSKPRQDSRVDINAEDARET